MCDFDLSAKTCSVTPRRHTICVLQVMPKKAGPLDALFAEAGATVMSVMDDPVPGKRGGRI